jgi:hypothetical protein
MAPGGPAFCDGVPLGPGGPFGPRGPGGPGGPLMPVPPMLSSPGGPSKLLIAKEDSIPLTFDARFARFSPGPWQARVSHTAWLPWPSGQTFKEKTGEMSTHSQPPQLAWMTRLAGGSRPSSLSLGPTVAGRASWADYAGMGN